MRLLILVFALLPCLSLPILQGCSGNVSAATASADRLNTYELITAAAAAHRAGRIEDAGFLFLAGQARYQIDKQVFPPAGKGGDDPGVLKAALSATLGPTIQSDLTSDPVVLANAAARLAKWSPKFDNGYEPGWAFQNQLDAKATAAVVSTTLKPAVSVAQAKAKLAQNDEYVKLSQVMKETGVVKQEFFAALQQGGGKAPREVHVRYQAAVERRNTAALRIKEIEFDITPESRWHPAVGWIAIDYFTDPQVIELCKAIEASDLDEMKRLIEAGADVNAVGKGGMTPLLWAFPDRQIERFRCLLEHGADPNVIIKSDFGVRHRPFHPYPAGGPLFHDRGCHPGQSVTHLAARSPEIEYLKLVFAHGADPNIVDKDTGMTPLDIVLDRHYSDSRERVELLVGRGADVDHYCQYQGGTPTMLAVQNNNFDIALFLLRSGADPKLYRPDSQAKLVHIVARVERRLADFPPQLASEYRALVDWLNDNGESLDDAHADQQEWDKRSNTHSNLK